MHRIEVVCATALPTLAELRAMRGLVLAVSAAAPAPWRRLPYGAALERRLLRMHPGPDQAGMASLDLPNRIGTHVSFARLDPALVAFERLTRARELIADQKPHCADELCIALVGFDRVASEAVAEALVSAAVAANVQLPHRRGDSVPHQELKRLRLFGVPARLRFARTLAEAEGNALARSLTVLPPNELTPAAYRRRLEDEARSYGWGVEFLDMARLTRLRAGAFLAVAQGSPDPDAGIAHLTYEPRPGAARPALALVGKGICFDTGGVNLKPAKAMLGMHEDMAGSAVALGVLAALTRLRVPWRVDAWLALATNHIGPRAYKPNDVVRALNGRTIEIVHTDAEGRMVLADTLTLASRAAPGLIIDYATLTGACIQALGTAMSGLFTTREDWLLTLLEAGRSCGERIWPFPLDPDYDEALKSTVADTRQCAESGAADHIIAARFLRSFVERDVPWIHLDLGSAGHKGGLAHVPTETTGFGVRYTLAALKALGWAVP